mmetsp:Transcript_28439/g.80252  ORF Transcript_28439/g.80252 Transcript_28439/m.80252 type:complete len:542 (+) Transcript_28439:167-1792(+)
MAATPAGALHPGLCRMVLQCCVLLSLAGLAVSSPGTGWSPSTIANPWTHPESCGRSVQSWICDPDSLLSKSEQDLVEGIAKQIAIGKEPYKTIPCGDRGEVGPQVAVAVVRRMDPQFAGRSVENAAEKFAKGVHGAWGVGFQECENGVLLFVSVEDRRVFISRGKGLTGVLSDHSLDNIIDRMKPYLKAKRYGDAVSQGVAHIGTTVAEGPDKYEGILEWLLISVFGSVFAGVSILSWRNSRQRQTEYKAVKVHLNRLSRSREEAAAGTYAASSCPICLEDFDPHPEELVSETVHEDSRPPSTDMAAQQGASGKVRARTRSGDMATGSVADAADPLLGPSGGSGGSPKQSSALQGQEQNSKQAKRNGATGGKAAREPVALPCGHVFCEPCIDEWMNSQRTCPICRKDPTRRPGDDGGSDGGDGHPPPPGGCQPEPQASGSGSSRRFWRRPRPGMNLTMDMAPELAFRLSSLQRRYPAYVTPNMVNRWSNDIHYGRQINWSSDSDFLHRDPARVEQTSSFGSSGGSRSFGGGRSGGGRGGGW